MTDHENLTVRLWDVIHDARSTPSGHAPTSAIVAAVLPIVAEEVRKAKVEAWNEGCRAAEQYYKRTIIGIPGSDPIPAPINPHETGDQA